MMLSIRQLSVGLCLLLTTPLVPAQAATPNLCTLFTTQEVKTLLGTEVAAGEPAAMGTGCQWFGKDEQSYAVVQMVSADYWVDPQQAPGYESIPKLGKQAYSHPDMEGGWRAMALTADAAASVVLIGKTATRANVVALVRQLLERQQKGK
jgi:hypothetical protein